MLKQAINCKTINDQVIHNLPRKHHTQLVSKRGGSVVEDIQIKARNKKNLLRCSLLQIPTIKTMNLCRTTRILSTKTKTKQVQDSKVNVISSESLSNIFYY